MRTVLTFTVSVVLIYRLILQRKHIGPVKNIFLCHYVHHFPLVTIYYIFRALSTQSSVLVRSQHIIVVIIYCNKIFTSILAVQTLLLHLCDMLQLVKNE
jgi:hypothetical protein